MISGKIQLGDYQYTQVSPAGIPVAGDAATSAYAPTYASLVNVASLNGDHRAPNRTGQTVREGLGRDGNVGAVDNLSGLASYVMYEPTTGHNIPGVFWSFMNQKGVTYHSGTGYMENDTVVDWLFAMGYPITEPYWIRINIGGQDRWVLMQAFQRRVLTYSPYNPAGWQVEMGNVGRAYFDWRTSQLAPVPTPTALPNAPASIAINPSSGDATTRITVTGKNFPKSAIVMLGVEKPSANFFRSLGSVGAGADGSFSKIVTLPADAAGLGEVAITAAANSGAVRATATFQFNFAPTITVFPHEIVPRGVVRVQGEGFPPNMGIKLGALPNNTSMQWLRNAWSDRDGDFDVTMPTGNYAVGTTFRVIAQGDGGYKATTPTLVRVIDQPTLRVMPNTGPVGANVSLQGANWPPNAGLSLGTRAADGTTDTWRDYIMVVDAGGKFSITVNIDPKYAGKSEVRLIAFDVTRDLRLEAPYYVTPGPTPTPTPLVATVSISPNVLAIGQPATVTGDNWPAGWAVSIGVGRPGLGVEEWLTTAQVGGARSFSTAITLGPRWQDVGQLVVTATILGGKTATGIITVVPTAGRITPMGLNMSVSSFTRLGSTMYKVNSEGWQPGSYVHISIVSADGSINTEVATTIAGDRGALQAGILEAAPWAGRSDLGVRATTLDGLQYSLRYLPVTEMTKVKGSAGTYMVAGVNWPASARIDVLVYDEESKNEVEVLRTIVTDPNGAFNFTMDPRRIPSSIKNDVELRTVNQPYSAVFDF
jgi:hypothetical protein